MIFPSEPSRERVKVSHVIIECTRLINHHPACSAIMKIEVEMTRKQRAKNKMADSDCGLRHNYLLNLPMKKCL